MEQQNNIDMNWEISKRVAWWVKFLGAVFVMTGAVLGLGKWIYTRASVEDIEAVARQKIDVVVHDRDIEKLDKRVEKQERVLGTIHLNVVRLMEKNNVQPTRLPTDDNQ
jgi:hypothetical protein